MSAAAVRRMERYSLRKTFDQFWGRHLGAAVEAEGADEGDSIKTEVARA
jgi:hypothetical protein